MSVPRGSEASLLTVDTIPQRPRPAVDAAAGQLERVAALEPNDALQALGSARGGLSRAEAAALLERYGPNELGRAGRTWLSILAAQLKSPLLGLLVVAAAV